MITRKDIPIKFIFPQKKKNKQLRYIISARKHWNSRDVNYPDKCSSRLVWPFGDFFFLLWHVNSWVPCALQTYNNAHARLYTIRLATFMILRPMPFPRRFHSARAHFLARLTCKSQAIFISSDSQLTASKSLLSISAL